MKGGKAISKRYDRYLQGAYQEVYDELLAMQEQVFDEPIYAEALAVAREMMRRVRHNIELLIPRLEEMDYDFGAGFFDEMDANLQGGDGRNPIGSCLPRRFPAGDHDSRQVLTFQGKSGSVFGSFTSSLI